MSVDLSEIGNVVSVIHKGGWALTQRSFIADYTEEDIVDYRSERLVFQNESWHRKFRYTGHRMEVEQGCPIRLNFGQRHPENAVCPLKIHAADIVIA